VAVGGFDGFRQKQDAHESLPMFGPLKGKDLHLAYLNLYCWYSSSCYNALAEVEEEACASLYTWA
jgi:hypothetical protein